MLRKILRLQSFAMNRSKTAFGNQTVMLRNNGAERNYLRSISLTYLLTGFRGVPNNNLYLISKNLFYKKWFIINNSYFIIKTKPVKTLVSFILILFLLQTKTQAQPVNVTANLEDTIYMIGQHIPLNLTVERNADVEVEWPFLVDSIGSFEVLKSGKIDTIISDNKSIEKQQVFITHFDTGYHVIPPVEFTYKERRRTKKAKTEPFLIRMNTVEVDTTAAIMPIKNVIKMPLTFKEKLQRALIIAGIVLTILAIPLFIYFYFKRRKKEAYVPPPLPPYEMAIKRLRELKEKKLWQEGLIKEYYSELTDILRGYIEGRFELPALEMTTDEIAPLLKKKKEVTKGLFRNVIDLMTISDFVKFAKARPSTKYHADSFDQVNEFVRSTEPILTEAEEQQKQAALAGQQVTGQQQKSNQVVQAESPKTSSTTATKAQKISQTPETLQTKGRKNKKVLAGVLGIFLGFLGVHKFVLGYTKQGIIQIIISIFTCGFGGMVGFVEGIIYLTKSDDEFYETYQLNKKAWF